MRATYLFVPVLVAVAACDLINDPIGPMVVAITGPESAVGERTTNEEGAAIVECQVQLQAAATGGDEWSTATWMGAEVEWTDLETGELQQEQTWTAETVAALWGTPGLSSEQKRTNSWLFWSYAPFHLSASFRYYDSAMRVERSASYALACE